MTGRLVGLTAILVAVLALATASTVTVPMSAPAPAPGTAAPPESGTVPRTGQAGAGGAGDGYYPADGNGGYDVAGYHVSLTYDPATRHLEGDTTVTARAVHALSSFNLDLHRLEVRSVEVNGGPATFTWIGEHELVIVPAAVLGQGETFRVRVRYGGRPDRLGENTLGAGGWHANSSGGAVALGEPHSAAVWYPANDHPRDKATFELTARVPDGWSVVSNGVDSPPVSSGGWTTYHWTMSSPAATYLTTVAIDRWTLVRSTLPDGTPVVDAYAPGAQRARAAEDRLPEILAFLSERFGDYPFEAAGGIFLSASLGYALETQTRPVYPPDADVEFIVHENAHQWFGNSVSVANWADICLNECFATYAQWLWREAKAGADLDELYRSEVRRTSSELWSRKLYDMGAGNEFRGVYGKGVLAVHALRRQLGDATFDAVVKGWLARHAGGNASWPQFESYVEEVSGQQLDGFFEAWFRGTQRPPDEFLWPGSLRP
jgi:aminopeptidase N